MKIKFLSKTLIIFILLYEKWFLDLNGIKKKKLCAYIFLSITTN